MLRPAVDKLALGQISSEYNGFPCQLSLHKLLRKHRVECTNLTEMNVQQDIYTVTDTEASKAAGCTSKRNKLNRLWLLSTTASCAGIAFSSNCVQQNFPRIHFAFILVGCILLRYLYILYKHTTQNYTYVIRKRNLTTSLLFQNLTTCFGPYGPSWGDTFEDFLLYCDTPITFTSVRLSIAS
jgi:hypothetical protein